MVEQRWTGWSRAVSFGMLKNCKNRLASVGRRWQITARLDGRRDPSVRQVSLPLPESFNSSAACREFDVQRDCNEPQQEISFLTDKIPPCRAPSNGKSAPTASSKRRRAFGTPDEEAESAVSFAIGQGSGDWGPMTVYGLMRNGDVWALCPFLPKRW
jgi:hypothetical protein